MADPSFAQPARRNLTLPIALAALVLAIAAVALVRLSPQQTADAAIPHLAVYPSHLVFKSDSTVIGAQTTQDTLYVLATVRLTDRLRLPLFLKDFTAVLITADGSQTGVISAIEKPDLAQLLATFPTLNKLAAAQRTPPLYRETRVDPGQTAEGWLLLAFPVAAETWNARRSAVLSVDLYHQPPVRIDLPHDSAAAAALPPQSRAGPHSNALTKTPR